MPFPKQALLVGHQAILLLWSLCGNFWRGFWALDPESHFQKEVGSQILPLSWPTIFSFGQQLALKVDFWIAPPMFLMLMFNNIGRADGFQVPWKYILQLKNLALKQHLTIMKSIRFLPSKNSCITGISWYFSVQGYKRNVFVFLLNIEAGKVSCRYSATSTNLLSFFWRKKKRKKCKSWEKILEEFFGMICFCLP